MFVLPNRDIAFDLSEFVSTFKEPTTIIHNEFSIINATDTVLIISFHNNLKFAILGLNTKEEQEELKNRIAKEFEDSNKFIIPLPKINEDMKIRHLKNNINKT